MTAITSFWKCLPLQTPDSFPFAIDDEACVAQVRAPHTLPAGHTVTSPPGCAMCRVSCTHPQAARLLVSVQRLQRAWQVCAVDSERAKTPPALYQSLGCKLVCGDVCSWHALVLACGLTPPPLPTAAALRRHSRAVPGADARRVVPWQLACACADVVRCAAVQGDGRVPRPACVGAADSLDSGACVADELCLLVALLVVLGSSCARHWQVMPPELPAVLHAVCWLACVAVAVCVCVWLW